MSKEQALSSQFGATGRMFCESNFAVWNEPPWKQINPKALQAVTDKHFDISFSDTNISVPVHTHGSPDLKKTNRVDPSLYEHGWGMLQVPSSKPDDEIKAFQSCFGQFMLVWLGNVTKERNYAISSRHSPNPNLKVLWLGNLPRPSETYYFLIFSSLSSSIFPSKIDTSWCPPGHQNIDWMI